MKKLLLGALLLLSMFGFSQEKPFARKYNYSILENETKFTKIDLTVVFNYKGTKDVVFYLPGREIYMYRISEITTGKTKSGNPYQVFNCINGDGGEEVTLQLFDDNVLRVFMYGDYVEYHEK
jgi:hypothetical protein